MAVACTKAACRTSLRRLGFLSFTASRRTSLTEHSHYSRTKKVASAQAAISRAPTRLIKRGLLFYTPRRLTSNHECYGYFLSAAGLTASPLAVPEIDTALRFFGMKDRLMRWTKDEQGRWHADEWMRGKGAGYGISRIHDDFDVLRTVVDRSEGRRGALQSA
jgi:hypothetical protein